MPVAVRQMLLVRCEHALDRARARLSIIGSHSVVALVEALEGDNNRVRAHAMPLLALIQDPRGRVCGSSNDSPGLIVVPAGKALPLGGAQVRFVMVQLSVALVV
jgi:hypothetical protein